MKWFVCECWTLSNSPSNSQKLIERPHFLSTSGIWVKIKSVLKNFWSLVLKFTTPRYTLLFLYFETYIVHIINCEWSRSVNFLLRMFCMRYKHIFFHHLFRTTCLLPLIRYNWAWCFKMKFCNWWLDNLMEKNTCLYLIQNIRSGTAEN